MSDHAERACTNCGSLLHHEDDCPIKQMKHCQHCLNASHASDLCPSQMLGDLLAILHGDGGHYVAEHGLKKAVEDAMDKRQKMLSEIETLQVSQVALIQAHNEITSMISRYLVASKGHVAESWLEGFVECKAVTIDTRFPTGFIAPVQVQSARELNHENWRILFPRTHAERIKELLKSLKESTGPGLDMSPAAPESAAVTEIINLLNNHLPQ